MTGVKMDTPEKNFSFNTDGQTQTAHYTWFRGDSCNYNPNIANLSDETAAVDWILKGWLPPSQIIDTDTRIVAFGSCFAANITKHLSTRNFNVLTAKDGENKDAYLVRFGEGMVNTFVIRQQFEWALEGIVPEGDLWHGYDATSFGYDENVRQITKSVFDRADVFIITLGLSEVWYDTITSGVFWRAVPADSYDASRHKFRVTSFQENKDNIAAIYKLIRKHRPSAKVILTLSPIPLVATFRPVSCISANAVSKAILRAAIDEAMREIDEPCTLFYWPSYELATELFLDSWKSDRRHIRDSVLDYIMTLFQAFWCTGGVHGEVIKAAWAKAARFAGLANSRPREKVNPKDRSKRSGG